MKTNFKIVLLLVLLSISNALSGCADHDEGENFKTFTEHRKEVFPLWWECVWFKASITVLIAGAFIGRYWYRQRLTEQRSRELENQLTERAREFETMNRQLKCEIAERTEIQRNLLLLDMAVTQTAEGIAIADMEGYNQFVNKAWADMHGYTQEELQGAHMSLFHTEEQFQQEVRPFIEEVIKTGHHEGEDTHIKKDGTEFYTWMSVNVVKDKKGNPIAIVGACRDITLRRKYEEALHKAKEEADSANLAKSKFLSNMSHELRTPLNAVIGFSRLLAHSGNLTKDQQENIRIINRSGEHLLNLINDVLDMSKIEAGRTMLNEKDFDLHGMLDDLENMLGIRAREKELNMIFTRDPDVPRYIRTDEVKLRQTLINLINNAVKFTEQGEVQVLIKNESPTEISESETRLLFEIKDTGPGIAPEELDNLFEAFTQTETGRQSREGTGLGLPISRKFVRLMGGDITVDSMVGTGTTFRFDIRVSPADGADERQRHTKQRVVALEPGQTAYRILIADDHADNRQLLVKLLAPLGFDIREAENGQEAVEKWGQWKPHLIWMDMRMPVMNGYEATTKIKESTEGQATAVIALTASVYEEERSVVLTAGCDGFVRKPFHEHEIFEEMARHLGVRYVYEFPPADDAHPADEANELSPDDLLVMPVAWQTAFRDVVMAGYYDDCLELIEQIPADHAALISGLKYLIDEFAFDKLVQLTGKVERNDDIPT